MGWLLGRLSETNATLGIDVRKSSRTSPFRKCRIRSWIHQPLLSVKFLRSACVSRVFRDGQPPWTSDRPAYSATIAQPQRRSLNCAATGTFHLVQLVQPSPAPNVHAPPCTLLDSGTAPRWRESSRRGRKVFIRLSRSWHFRVCPHFSASSCISSSYNN
jgi:hypothetical protein